MKKVSKKSKSNEIAKVSKTEDIYTTPMNSLNRSLFMDLMVEATETFRNAPSRYIVTETQETPKEVKKLMKNFCSMLVSMGEIYNDIAEQNQELEDNLDGVYVDI